MLDFYSDLYQYFLTFIKNLNEATVRARQNASYLPELVHLLECHRNGPFNKQRVKNHYENCLYLNQNLQVTNYIDLRKREVSALNIFYEKTVNKNEPQIASFRSADIPIAMLSEPFVFVIEI